MLKITGAEPVMATVKPESKSVKNLARSLLRRMSDALTEHEENEAEHKSHFTPRAVQVFELAEQEAIRLNGDVIDTEHVLLGLVKLAEGVAANFLRRMGVDLENVRLKIEERVAGGGEMKMHHPMPLTRSVKKVLLRAEHEARSLFHAYVGTEHILLGLLSEQDGAAAWILQSLGVSAVEARRQIFKELDPNENWSNA
jgi:ATP-dependent Clp protease ATP-binding subunit ClpC